jgi:hypothetical protein
MTLLKLDSRLAAPKHPATELHYAGRTKKTGAMKGWLQLIKRGENGGKLLSWPEHSDQAAPRRSAARRCYRRVRARGARAIPPTDPSSTDPSPTHPCDRSLADLTPSAWSHALRTRRWRRAENAPRVAAREWPRRCALTPLQPDHRRKGAIPLFGLAAPHFVLGSRFSPQGASYCPQMSSLPAAAVLSGLSPLFPGVFGSQPQ